MDKKEYITPEGLKKIKKDLEELKTVKRREIAKRIEEAKALGDLSENSEYIEAKEAQSFNEQKIIELEEFIRNAVIISKTSKKNIVDIGSTVEFKFDGKKEELTIVGSEEADPIQGKISNESPLGKAFLGHKVGDEVEVVAPSGKKKYKIVSIN